MNRPATRKLFMRARRTEIELAKVNAEFKRVIKDHAQLNKAFRNAKAELAEEQVELIDEALGDRCEAHLVRAGARVKLTW